MGRSLTANASTGDEEVIIQQISEAEDRRGWMGIHVQDLTSSLAEALEVEEDGVLVSEVGNASPAEKAGLKAQDVILSINGKPIQDVDELMGTMANTAPDEKIHLQIVRDGRKKEIDMTLAAKPEMDDEVYIDRFGGGSDNLDWHMLQRFPPGLRIFKGFPSKTKTRLGVNIIEPDEALASYFDISEGRGVLITKVLAESPAEEAGLKSGDVVLSVDGKEITTTKGLQAAIEEAVPGEVEMKILRKGKEMKMKVHLGEADSHDSIHRKYGDPSDQGRLPEELQEQLQEMKGQLKKLQKEMEELRKNITDKK
ncbi:MAG: PDZ domain-containing protein [Candidatus Eisenbacteria bacterium]|uniref:PDZ domain-containing protein n=1 Tax=Eiseniibacteriota bacterium TaxID=2212470 RepID=A0A948RTZ7_UNCEI|nr:PDZ domain-containing protein [Candidatus Eisenbacteria bacterium]MBU2690516.1 PDZ domain-containing protein [Candidatus Eisenbacteria bacterium]